MYIEYNILLHHSYINIMFYLLSDMLCNMNRSGSELGTRRVVEQLQTFEDTLVNPITCKCICTALRQNQLHYRPYPQVITPRWFTSVLNLHRVILYFAAGVETGLFAVP